MDPSITLKLLIDKSSKKVIFVEAEKDFVDFLFGLMEIPLGSLMGLLGNMSQSFTLSNVYESVIELDKYYLQPEQTKQILLHPGMPSSNTKGTPLLQQLEHRKTQYEPFGYRSNSKEVDGYVKAAVTYMISDDLNVKPVSTISSISLMNDLGVKNVAALEEKKVQINLQKISLILTSHMVSQLCRNFCVTRTRPDMYRYVFKCRSLQYFENLAFLWPKMKCPGVHMHVRGSSVDTSTQGEKKT